jgi:hypothetical protein
LAVVKLDLANLTGVTVDRFGSQAATYLRIADMGPGGAVGVITWVRRVASGCTPHQCRN